MGKKFTKQGYEKLKKELDFLKNVKQKEIAAQLKHAAGFGDFSENAAYDQAKEAKSFLRGRILELEKLLLNAEIVEKTKNAEKICIGSIVTISSNGEEEKIEIVGAEEADPLNGKISASSPLGTALKNKKVNEEAVVRTETREIIYKIIKIE